MIVATENSTYILEDKGDGAYGVTSDNPRYRGPNNMTLEGPIAVGNGLVMRFNSGPKKGRFLITSRILRVEAD